MSRGTACGAPICLRFLPASTPSVGPILRQMWRSSTANMTGDVRKLLRGLESRWQGLQGNSTLAPVRSQVLRDLRLRVPEYATRVVSVVSRSDAKGPP